MPPEPAARPAARFAAQFAEKRSFVLLIAAIATIGPFSMDTFLPSLPQLSEALGATDVQAQQSLSAYLLGFGIMSLWHGAISDAVGRRPVILVALAVYALAALACTLAPTIEVLIGARLVQGLFGGAGMIVSRAIVRDCYEGVQAQRLMASVMLIFSIAPVIAPVLGGYLHEWFGWRSVFGFMLTGAVCLGIWTWRALPETHPPQYRTPLHAGTMLRTYASVLGNREFMLLAGAIAFNFSTFFVYVMASPAFILKHLQLTPTDFGVFFIPVVAGMMLGSTLSGRLAGRITVHRIGYAGFALMAIGITVNVLLQWLLAPSLAPGRWLTAVSIAPLFVTGVGQSMITPSVQLLMMDLFPKNRGMVSSCQGFTQVMLSTVTAGVIAPLVSDTALHLALASAVYFACGLSFWLLYSRVRRK